MKFLEKQGQNPLIQRERQRISMVRQSFLSAPETSIKGVPTSHARRALGDSEIESISLLATNIQGPTRRLLASGWFDFAREEMRSGRNPGRKPWQRILCEGLLNGGISRRDLQAAFEVQLNLNPASARVRASTAVSVYTAGRLLIEHSGRLVLSQN
jgi:hypothetical protein